jgi:threonine/homoserine/homoserine lactone efflux protein
VSTAFLITALLIVLAPGPGAVYTVSTGLARGARASLVAAVGCTLGIVPHLIAAITGTAALLQASGTAFEAVKALGVAFLLWMAWQAWRDRSELEIDATPAPRSPLRIIRSAVLTNLLNPKLTIFFFAFLPQFIPSHAPDQLARLIVLSLVFMAMTLVVFAGYGLFAAAVRRRVIAQPQIILRIRRAFAVSFVALGVKLAATSR